MSTLLNIVFLILVQYPEILGAQIQVKRIMSRFSMEAVFRRQRQAELC